MTTSRRFPRRLRVAELLREVIAEELERIGDEDGRLELVTVTAVEPTPDNRNATVYLSSLSEETKAALVEHRVRLQRAIGRQASLKRTPLLAFEVDAGVQTGARVEEILRGLPRDPGSGGADG